MPDKKLKKFIVVAHEAPKINKKKPHNIREVTDLVNNSEGSDSDSHNELIEHLNNMEKIVISIINNNDVKVACNCFNALKKCLTKK